MSKFECFLRGHSTQYGCDKNNYHCENCGSVFSWRRLDRNIIERYFGRFWFKMLLEFLRLVGFISLGAIVVWATSEQIKMGYTPEPFGIFILGGASLLGTIGSVSYIMHYKNWTEWQEPERWDGFPLF